MRLLQGHFSALAELFLLLKNRHDLVSLMVWRELTDRYSGYFSGFFWMVFHPIFMALLYVAVFTLIFRVKIGGTEDMPRDYAIYMLSGFAAWTAFHDSMMRSCTALSSNAALVRQVVFPVEILPIKVVVAALFPQAVSLTVLIVYSVLSHGSLPVTVMLLPVLLVVQVLAMSGMAYVLSAVGAYVRDIKDVVQAAAVVAMYLTPMFYLPAWVPEIMRPLLYLNPFSYVIWCYQDALYFGRIEHPWAWVINAVLSIAVFIVGYRLFRKAKTIVGNVF